MCPENLNLAKNLNFANGWTAIYLPFHSGFRFYTNAFIPSF